MGEPTKPETFNAPAGGQTTASSSKMTKYHSSTTKSSKHSSRKSKALSIALSGRSSTVIGNIKAKHRMKAIEEKMKPQWKAEATEADASATEKEAARIKAESRKQLGLLKQRERDSNFRSSSMTPNLIRRRKSWGED